MDVHQTEGNKHSESTTPNRNLPIPSKKHVHSSSTILKPNQAQRSAREKARSNTLLTTETDSTTKTGTHKQIFPKRKITSYNSDYDHREEKRSSHNRQKPNRKSEKGTEEKIPAEEQQQKREKSERKSSTRQNGNDRKGNTRG